MDSDLLKKAKATKVRKRGQFTSKEHIALALAWARGEVGTTQVQKAYGITHSGSEVYHRLAMALRAHIQQQA